MTVNTISSYINDQFPKDVTIHKLKEILGKIEKNNHLIKKKMQEDLEPLQNDPDYLIKLIEKKPKDREELRFAVQEIYEACCKKEYTDIVCKLKPTIDFYCRNVSDILPNELIQKIIFDTDLKKASLINKKWHSNFHSTTLWVKIAQELEFPPKPVDHIQEYVLRYFFRLNKTFISSNHRMYAPKCLTNPTTLTEIKLLQDWKEAKDRLEFYKLWFDEESNDHIDEIESILTSGKESREETSNYLLKCKDLFSELRKETLAEEESGMTLQELQRTEDSYTTILKGVSQTVYSKNLCTITPDENESSEPPHKKRKIQGNSSAPTSPRGLDPMSSK